MRGAYVLVAGYATYKLFATNGFSTLDFNALIYGSGGLGEGLLYWTHPARTVGTRVIAGWLVVLGAFLIGVGAGGGATWSASGVLFLFVLGGSLAVMGLIWKTRETLQTVDPDVFS